MHVGEPWQDIPDRRDAAFTGTARAAVEIIAPRYAVTIEEPGEIGPNERRLDPRPRPLARDIALTTRGIVPVRTLRRPAGDQVKVRRQAIRRDRFEHVVVQDECFGIRPVIRNVGLDMIRHHATSVLAASFTAIRVCRIRARRARVGGNRDEPIHLSAIDRACRRLGRVRRATVSVLMIDEGRHAGVRCGVRQTGCRRTSLHRNAVNAGERPEVMIE